MVLLDVFLKMFAGSGSGGRMVRMVRMIVRKMNPLLFIHDGDSFSTPGPNDTSFASFSPKHCALGQLCIIHGCLDYSGPLS